MRCMKRWIAVGMTICMLAGSLVPGAYEAYADTEMPAAGSMVSGHTEETDAAGSMGAAEGAVSAEASSSAEKPTAEGTVSAEASSSAGKPAAEGTVSAEASSSAEKPAAEGTGVIAEETAPAEKPAAEEMPGGNTVRNAAVPAESEITAEASSAEEVSEEAEISTLAAAGEDRSVPDKEDIEYTFTAEWNNAVSPDVKNYSYAEDDPEHRNLIFHTLDNQRAAAQMGVSLKLNLDKNASLPAGSVRITVPAWLFESWDGSGEVNLVSYYKPDPRFTWQIPKAPEQAKTSDFNYTDNGDGTCTVTNFREITGGKTLDFVQSFSFRPSLVKVDDQGKYRKDFGVRLEIDTAEKIEEKKEFGIEVRNHHAATTLSLKKDDLSDEQGVFFDWMETWGPRPADADKYFYVAWFADLDKAQKNTIPFDMVVSQEPSDGELIGVNRDHAQDRKGTTHSSYIAGGTNTRYPDIVKENYTDKLTQPGLLSFISPKSYDTLGTTQGTDYYSHTALRFIMLKRYPVSLLEEAKARGVDLAAEGIKVRNKVLLTDRLANGETKTVSAEAEAEVHVFEYAGKYGISKRNSYNDGWNSQQAGQDFILQDEALRLNGTRESRTSTFTTNAFTNAVSEPVWHEEIKTYTVKPYTAVITEGDVLNYSNKNNHNATFAKEEKDGRMEPLQDGDVVYRSVYFDLKEYDATKSSLGAWQGMKNPSRDYGRMRPILLYIRKAGSSDYTLHGSVTVDGNGKYNFRSADGQTELRDVKNGNMIPLPDNTTGLRYSHESDYFQSSLTAYPMLEIQSTDSTKQWIQADKDKKRESYYASSAGLEVKEDGQTRWTADTKYQPAYRAGGYLEPLRISAGIAKAVDSVKDDVNNGMQTARIHLVGNQYTSLWDSGQKVTQYFQKYLIDSMVFWDLLPAGVTVDPASFEARAGQLWSTRKLDANGYDVEFIPNWEGSGQTMMKIMIRMPEDKREYQNYTNPGVAYHFYYDMKNSYNNISDRGNSVLNTMAFENASENAVLMHDFNINSISRKDYYRNISAEHGKGWMFTECSVNFAPVTVKQSGVAKLAANDHDNEFLAETKTWIGNRYTYQLAYSMGNNTRADNIVFYDVLDNGTASEASQWKGTLDWIDVTAAQEKPAYGYDGETCAPVIYYAVRVPSAAEMDIANTDVWSTAKPADPKQVKAIAIDCTKTNKGHDFALDQGMGLNVYVHMISPSDEALDRKSALNQLRVAARTFNGMAPLGTEPVKILEAQAKVLLHKIDVELEKTSEPASGTEQAPFEIANEKDTPIVYTLKVRNKDGDLDARKIVLEDEIPQGLTVDTENIRVSCEKLKLEDKPYKEAQGISLKQEKNKLTFVISTLPAEGEISFAIPARLTEKTVKTTVFANTAEITSVEEQARQIRSETTWHKVIRAYELNYVVQPDPDYGVPEGSTVPGKTDGIEYGTDKRLAKPLTTDKKAAQDGTQGSWKFAGWGTNDKDIENSLVTSLEIKQNETVYGKWIFVPSRDITVTKKWKDAQGNDWQDKTAYPSAEVTAELYRDGVKTDLTQKLNKANNWTAVFKDLERDSVRGTEHQYTVRETGLDAALEMKAGDGKWYRASVDGTMQDGFTITNRQQLSWEEMIPSTTALKVVKKWEGENSDRMDPVRIRLIKNGRKTDQYITLSKENGWTDSFRNLPTMEKAKIFSPDKKDINTYTVEEEGAQDSRLKIGEKQYSVQYSLMPGDGKKESVATVINTLHNPKISVSGEKIWEDENDQDGIRPGKVKIHLLANGEETGRIAEASAETGWKYSFENLDTYSRLGEKLQYTVDEEKVSGYETIIKSYTVTNRHKPETMDIPVQKIWLDKNDEAGTRPDSITVRLFADGKETQAVKLTKDDEWKHVFARQAKFRNGKAVVYEVKEDEVRHYDQTITGNAADGFRIENRRVPEVHEGTVPPVKTPQPPVEKGKEVIRTIEPVQQRIAKSPATGDASGSILYVFVFITAIFGIYLLRKKRKV